MLKNYTKIIIYITGLLLLALGINLMITAQAFGVSPWDAFFIALTDHFGFSIGFWMFLLNLLFCSLVWVFKRIYFTIGTLLTMVAISFFVDGIFWAFHDDLSHIPDVPAFLLGGTFIGFGIGVYVSTALCYAPQEGFVLMVSEKFKWSYQRTEIALSFLVLIISVSMAGAVGWGTLFLTFYVGIVIQYSMSITQKYVLTNKGELES